MRPIVRRKTPSLRTAGGSPRRSANERMSPPAMKWLARAAQHDDPQGVVRRHRGRMRDERVDHRGIERVERVRPIERQRRDGTVAGEQYGVVHRTWSCRAWLGAACEIELSPRAVGVAERARGSSSSIAWATSTRSLRAECGDRARELSIGDRVRRPRGHRHEAAGELVDALRAALEARDLRARCRIRSPGNSRLRSAGPDTRSVVPQ